MTLLIANGNKLVIDKEFRDFIPMMTEDEFSKLEASVLSEGCREAIIIWGEIIVDGYNRYEICQKHDIPFGVTEREFADREEVKEWIILNQLGRRNLNDYNRGVLALLLKDSIATKARANKQSTQLAGLDAENNPVFGSGNITGTEGDHGSVETSGNTSAIETREEVAKIAGVSGRTLDKIETIQEKGSNELKQAAMHEKVSISSAAAIAELPQSEQNQVLELSDSEIIKKAREIITSKPKKEKKKKASTENVKPQDLVAVYRLRVKEIAGEIKQAIKSEPQDLAAQIRKAIAELTEIAQELSPSEPSSN